MGSDKAFVEAALFVSADPVKAKDVADTVGLDTQRVMSLLGELQEEYRLRGAGIEIVESNGSWVMRPRPEYEQSLTTLIPETDLSRPVIKTLALIAYEQPIKQSYVVKIRGTRAYCYIRQLLDLGLIEGRRKGNTKILSTTPRFKEYFRLRKGDALAGK